MFGKESKADRYEFTNIGLEDVSLNETRGVEANLMHSLSSTDSATKVKTGLLSGTKHEIFVATSEWVHALLSVRGNPRMAEGTVKVKVRVLPVTLLESLVPKMTTGPSCGVRKTLDPRIGTHRQKIKGLLPP